MGFEDSVLTLVSADRRFRPDVERVRDFLAGQGFDYDPAKVDYTAVLETPDGRVGGTGSIQGDVVMLLAVDPAFRATDSAARLVTHLVNRILKQGQPTAFVFTRPGNAAIFEGLGFREVASVPPLMALFEFGYRSVRDFAARTATLAPPPATGRAAAIVVNANPFTRGHRSLIEWAAAENAAVTVFVVEEDRSAFPFTVRFDLVRRGVADLGNVAVVPGGRYVISGATFPTYFLKSENPDAVTRAQADLDVTVFGRWIVPALKIKRRYVGTEPASPTTQTYNRAMHDILPHFGVQVVEVERVRLPGPGGRETLVSASAVRRAIAQGRLEAALDMVPEVTRDYLLSEAARPVLARLDPAGRG